MDHKFHVHLVSDSTGETLHAMTNAALAQFENVDVHVHPYAMVRSEHQLGRALDHIAIMSGIVFFTLANQSLREKLLARCKDIGVRAIDLLEGPVTALRQFLGSTETHKVGRQHEVDARYLDRIEALNFTIAHDDGQSLDSIDQAQVILTGASRTSKTPTCVYLAIRGVRAANVPLVPRMPPPPQLLAAKAPLIVGLWVSPDRLVQVRRNRLITMGEGRDTDYIELDSVRAEIAATRQLFENQEWPMIDVSRRSIEETAAAVMNLLAERGEGRGVTPLVLASGSASRKALLTAAGVDFVADPADLDEVALMAALKSEAAEVVARRLAEEKALHVSRRHPGAVVLGGDSVIELDGMHLSKCATLEAARVLLARMSGRSHLLVSAAALAREGTLLWAHASPCQMTMRDLSPQFLDDYIAACGPAILSSVGCYHYEGRGAQLFDTVDGDYFAVLGLPLLPVLAALRKESVLAC